MAYQQPQYAYPPQGGAGYNYQMPPPVAPAYGQQPQHATYGYPQAPAPAGHQQPYQQQQQSHHHQQQWQPQAPVQSPQQPMYQAQPAYPSQPPVQSPQQTPYQAPAPSYPPHQSPYFQPAPNHQAPHPQQYHAQQQPQHFQQQQQSYPPQPQQQYQPQTQVPPPQSQLPPGIYPLLPLPGIPLSKPTKHPFSLTLTSPYNPAQPLYTLTYNSTVSSLTITRGSPSSQPSPPIATASFPSLSLSKSPASLGPYNYQIDTRFTSFTILPGQSLNWAVSVSGASAGSVVLTPEDRKDEVIAKFTGTDAAGKLAVPGGTKKYIQGKLELLRGLTQAQMDEVFLTLGVELERKRRQAGGAKTAEGTWWGSQILSGVLSA
ncbi:hypothetical protein QBC40DRAFT_250016 [Triangularia verruculosa]|uniref:Uncharacterized protein n=1 Tax=Triangularia verruculosa TaxID=2587418 RepID=A0AAN6XRX4_9PEZI|nr:hypothetical protein QBC40DRAFT_250016 [Triangularia verruculosa]